MMNRSDALRSASSLPRRFARDGAERIRTSTRILRVVAPPPATAAAGTGASTATTSTTAAALAALCVFGGTVLGSASSTTTTTTTTSDSHEEGAGDDREQETCRNTAAGPCRLESHNEWRRPITTSSQPPGGLFATWVRPTSIRPSDETPNGLTYGVTSWPWAAALCESAPAVPSADPSPTGTREAHYGSTTLEAHDGSTTVLVENAAAGVPPPKPTPTTLSWRHRALYRATLLRSLPLPRRVGPNDPDLVLTRSQIHQRRNDEKRARQLQQRLVQLLQQRQQLQQPHQHQQQSVSTQLDILDQIDQQVARLVQELYGVLYGDGVTPQTRQDFLERYGCTGWTDHAVEAVLRWAAGSDSRHPRGLVEIGAGHGQWARHITDRYNKNVASALNEPRTQPLKPFDIVLAYDDGSSLPMNSDVYHRQTKPHRDYFYDRVRSCPSIAAVLSQWQCRGRVLLLVYPPPDSNMARDALHAYASVDAGTSNSRGIGHNDTLIYVGEGRGGANASDAFFDMLESGQWILEEIVEVQPMGSKGYERMYIFTRSRPDTATRSARGVDPVVE